MHRPQYGLQDPAKGFPDPLRQPVAAVGAVGEHHAQATEGAEFVEHEAGSVVVLPVGAMNDDRPDESERIDGQVSLAAGDLFSRVVAAFVASLSRANRLAVDDGHAGGRLLATV